MSSSLSFQKYLENLSLQTWTCHSAALQGAFVSRCHAKAGARVSSFSQWIFTKTQLRWSIIDKETFPIIVATDRLDRLRHFLLSSNGFRLFTDQKDLVYGFNTWCSDADFNKQIVEKLFRRVTNLSAFRYTIEHVSGETNVWVVILSKWKPNLTEIRLAQGESMSHAERSSLEFDVERKI